MRLSEAPETIGWDAAHRGFVLPNFIAKFGGDIDLIDSRLFADTAPAQLINPHNVTDAEKLARPSMHDDSCAVFWASIIAVLTNIIAPSQLKATNSIALHGAGAVAVGEGVAEAMGCVVHSVHNSKTARSVVEAEGEHLWPMLLEIRPETQRRYIDALTSSEGRHGNRIASVSWHDATVKALVGDWHVIVGEQPVCTVGYEFEYLLEMAGELLPEYLREFCGRYGRIGDRDHPLDSLAAEIATDLERFVDDRYGCSDDVRSAWEVLRPSSEYGHADALADLLTRFVRDDELNIEDFGGNKQRTRLLRVPEGDGLLLKHATLARLLKAKGVPVPDTERITSVLAQADLLIEDREDGWVFPEAWLFKRLAGSELAVASE